MGEAARLRKEPRGSAGPPEAAGAAAEAAEAPPPAGKNGAKRPPDDDRRCARCEGSPEVDDDDDDDDEEDEDDEDEEEEAPPEEGAGDKRKYPQADRAAAQEAGGPGETGLAAFPIFPLALPANPAFEPGTGVLLPLAFGLAPSTTFA